MGSSSQLTREKSLVVAEDDLEHLCRLVEEKDGGPAWIHMMNRSTATMSYQAWRRVPEVGSVSSNCVNLDASFDKKETNSTNSVILAIQVIDWMVFPCVDLLEWSSTISKQHCF